MNKIPPQFNFRNTPTEWRCIDLRTTKQIAHLCSRGVDFSGCSKADVIEGMAKPNGYNSEGLKFVSMMDAMARFLPRLKGEFDETVSKKIRELAKEK